MKKHPILAAALTLCLTLSLLCAGAEAASSNVQQEALQILGIFTGEENPAGVVTRAQFARLLVAASTFKDSAAGCKSSLFQDLKGDHWASGEVRIAVEQGWMSGYVDGTFRPDQSVTLEEGCAALLKLLGYDASAMKGAYPAAQLSKAGSIGLLDDVPAVQGSGLTWQDCGTLFYNLLTVQTSGGAVYGTVLGYTVTNGQVDYSALVSAGTKGPYVAEENTLSLPFTPKTVYYNGEESSLSAVQQYDVYYYNANMGTVWVYHDRVTGTFTGCSPSRTAPDAATVAGVSYPLKSSDAAYALSSQGSFQEGDTSTKAASTPSTAGSDAASAQVTTQVACTDGVVRTFYHTGSTRSAGTLVSVSVTGSGTEVKGLSTKRLEGTVSQDGSRLAGLRLAGGVQILDTDSGGGFARVYPSRLAGVALSGEDVRCYTLNAAGEIDRLVLQNVTGDTRPYVYLSGVEDSSSEMNTSVRYTYIQDGQTQSISGGMKYSVQAGGAMLVQEKGTLKSLRQLTSVRLDSLTALSALGDGREYPLAEEVQVLLMDDSGGRSYYPAQLSQIDPEHYSLTGWYDDLGFSAGGRIRIIIAVPR